MVIIYKYIKNSIKVFKIQNKYKQKVFINLII